MENHQKKILSLSLSELIERDHYDYPEHCRLEHACHQSNFEVIKAEIAVLKASLRKDNYRSVLKTLIETGVAQH